MTEMGNLSNRLTALLADPWWTQRAGNRSDPLMIDVVKVVAAFYGKQVGELRNPTRKYKHQIYAYPRHIAMFFCRMLTAYSYPEIARYFFRDHTTVIYAVRKIDNRMAKDKVLVRELEILRDRIEAERQAMASDADQ